MCAVRPTDVGKGIAPSVILTDRPCINCRYNLKGLKSDGKCPECGVPIRTRKNLPRFYDQLTNAPMEWIETFALGGQLTAIGATIMVLCSAMWPFQPHWGVGAIASAAAVACWVGVFLVTRPRPVTLATQIDPRIEWKWMRWSSRLTQACWPLGLALMTEGWRQSLSGGFLPPLLINAGAGATLIAIAGIAPFCWLASNLAFWAADYSLGQKMRVCAWVGWFAALLAVANTMNLRVGSFSGMVGTIIVTLRAAVILAPSAYLLYCLWSMRNLGAWAMLNHIQAEMKTERMRENAKAILNKPEPVKKSPSTKAAASPNPARNKGPVPASSNPAGNKGGPATSTNRERANRGPSRD